MGKYRPDRLITHVRTWLRLWVPHCRSRGVHDPFKFNVIELANLIAAVQQDAERLAESGKAQHARLKEARAGVNAIWSMLQELDASRSNHVVAIAKRAKLVAPMRARYSSTWDLQLLFDWFKTKYDEGWRFTATAGPTAWPFAMHRAAAAAMLRMRSIGRSGDVSTLTIHYSKARHDQTDKSEFKAETLRGSNGLVLAVRWYEPKHANSLADVYDKWVELGEYLPGDHAAYCVRLCVETYRARRMRLAARCSDDKLFITSIPRKGMYNGIAMDTVRNDVGKIMKLAGVPEEYLPHSLRHAAGAKAKQLGVAEPDVLKRASMSSHTYRQFYEKPIETLDGGAVAPPSASARRWLASSEMALGWTPMLGRGARRVSVPTRFGGEGSSVLREQTFAPPPEELLALDS